MTNEELHDTLNTLIRVLRDGRGFYADAANRVDNQKLKILFRDVADRRSAIIEDLNYRVQAHGGRPSQIGTATGALSEMFMRAKESLANDDEASLMSSIEESEDRSLETLKQAMDKGLPGPDQRALIRHIGEIQESQNLMRAFAKRLS